MDSYFYTFNNILVISEINYFYKWTNMGIVYWNEIFNHYFYTDLMINLCLCQVIVIVKWKPNGISNY